MDQELLTIRSQELTVAINLKGAEVRKVTNNSTQTEYMWEGSPEIWPGVSPVLFPIVGKANLDQVKHGGKSYNLTNHGFARHSLFNVDKHLENEIVLSLAIDSLGDGVYPFDLILRISYTVQGTKLITSFTVINNGNTFAYFSLGAHPAFKCPFDDLHDISEYIIEFEEPEQLICHPLNPEAFFLDKTFNITLKQIELSQDIFDSGALVYSGYASRSVSLVEKTSGRSIKVSLSGFPYLGLWAKPGAKFICIEPWCGHGDKLGFSGNISEKEGIIGLLPGGNWKNSYSIEFNYSHQLG